MTSEAPGTLPKHKLHVCSQMETNGCLPWRPHKKNAVTFTVKCNLLFNMQQTEIEESWEWTPAESSYSTSDFFGRSRPFRNRSGPWEVNCTTDHIVTPRSEKVAGSILCWVGQGVEPVWHHIVSHSGSLLTSKGRKLLLNWTKETIQALYGTRLRHVVKLMETGLSCTRAPLSISRMQQIRAPIPCQCLTKWQQKPSQVSCWEMPAGTDKSLTVSPWDCRGLALCQNRILFKLKIYWFKFRKTLLCCFYNQIRGWGNFDLYFFFFLWHLIWVWEGTIFSKLVLRTKVSKQDDYHFLWITVHVKSWACYIMQKQLKWNKQKYLFAYINFAKSSVGRKRGNTHKLTTAKHTPQVNLVQYFFKEENTTRLQDCGQESKANNQNQYMGEPPWLVESTPKFVSVLGLFHLLCP